MRFRFFICLMISCWIASASRADPATVTVFAAASLRDVLNELAPHHAGAVELSYGGSGDIARQVAAGAPADAVILANTQWMDWLQDHAEMRPGSRRDIASNQLVLVGPTDAPAPPAEVLPLLGPDGRLAMGQRDAVPAGIYAREWLQSTGQWDGVMHRLAETDNVRAALALVTRGQSPVAVVYASDLRANTGLHILARIPADSHSPITYPAAALTPAGQSFINDLTSPAAQAVFAKHGFGAIAE